MVCLTGKRSTMTSKMVDYSSRYSPYGSNEQHGVENSYDLADTLRILKEKIRSCKEDNDMIISTQEKQAEVNAVILHNLSTFQRQRPLQINLPFLLFFKSPNLLNLLLLGGGKTIKFGHGNNTIPFYFDGWAF